MPCSGMGRSARILVLLIACGAAAPAHAEPTPLVIVGGLYDSPTSVLAPALYLRWPLDEAQTLTLSQLGWTSGAAFSLTESPALSWQTSIEFTPLRGHLSHDMYAADGRTRTTNTFDASSLRISTGQVWETRPWRVFARAVVVKEWLSDANWPGAADFRTVFAGSEWKFVIQELRVRDPFDARIEGARLALRGQLLISRRLWADADVTLLLGRAFGPLFARLAASAFYVNWDTPVSNVLVGGSWDTLGANALFGFPLSAFRLQHGASASAGLDLRLVGALELGLRGALCWGATQLHGGIGVVLHAAISGVHLVLGAASPDALIARGDVASTAVFASVGAALLFLP
jgi:hypothetical protein